MVVSAWRFLALTGKIQLVLGFCFKNLPEILHLFEKFAQKGQWLGPGLGALPADPADVCMLNDVK